MSELQVFILAMTIPLAFFGISLNQIIQKKIRNPKLGIVSFLFLLMVNPPN
jgi:hypothetical protein